MVLFVSLLQWFRHLPPYRVTRHFAYAFLPLGGNSELAEQRTVAELASDLRCFERLPGIAESQAVCLPLFVLHWDYSDALFAQRRQKISNVVMAAA